MHMLVPPESPKRRSHRWQTWGMLFNSQCWGVAQGPQEQRGEFGSSLGNGNQDPPKSTSLTKHEKGFKLWALSLSLSLEANESSRFPWLRVMPQDSCQLSLSSGKARSFKMKAESQWKIKVNRGMCTREWCWKTRRHSPVLEGGLGGKSQGELSPLLWMIFKVLSISNHCSSMILWIFDHSHMQDFSLVPVCFFHINQDYFYH